mgnify:CR=1 FL=1
MGVRRTNDGCLKFTLDGNDLGVAATNIPKVKNNWFLAKAYFEFISHTKLAFFFLSAENLCCCGCFRIRDEDFSHEHEAFRTFPIHKRFIGDIKSIGEIARFRWHFRRRHSHIIEIVSRFFFVSSIWNKMTTISKIQGRER